VATTVTTLDAAGADPLADWEVERIQQYLSGCAPVLVTAERRDDLLNAAHRDVVPMSVLTDGDFAWCEAVAYYLRRHRVPPDPALLAHIRARDYTVPLIDGAAIHRATALVRDAAVVGQLWSFGEPTPGHRG
jgi:hypothetical protein